MNGPPGAVATGPLRADGRLGVVVIGPVPPPVHGQALANVALAGGCYRRLDLELVATRFSRDVADVGRIRPGKLAELPRVLWRALRARSRAGGRRAVLVYGVGLRRRGAAVRDIVLLAALRPWFAATVLHVHTGECRAVLDTLPGPLRWAADRAYGNAHLVIYPDPLLDADGQGLPRPRRVEYLAYGIEDPLASAGGVPADGEEDAAPATATAAGARASGTATATAAGARASGADGPMVLFMANLYPSKGTEVLIDAFAEVVGRCRADGAPLPRLVLVGAPAGPDTFAALWARAADVGVADLVRLPGAVFGPDKAVLFRSAAVFCFPTFFEAEAMPLVLFEAMAHGLPVLTTDWRAIPRVITDGVDGVLVPAGDTGRLAAELGRLVADPERRAEIGAAARATFLGRFTVDAFRARFEAVLCANLMEERSASVPAGAPVAGEVVPILRRGGVTAVAVRAPAPSPRVWRRSRRLGRATA